MACNRFPGHKCQLNNVRSETNLPRLLPTASWSEKLLRWLHKAIMVTRRNPITARNFSSQAAIVKENRRLKKLPYYIIHPCSLFSAIWFVIIIFTYAIYLSVIPVIIVFHEHIFADSTNSILLIAIEITTSVILYLEIVAKLHTSYYDHEHEMFVLSKPQIRKKYLRSTLFPDIISAFPSLLLIKFNLDYEEYRLELVFAVFVCFLLNFLNVPKILRYYQVISNYYDLSTTSDLMIKLGIGSLYILHIVALTNIIVPEYIIHHFGKDPTDWDQLPPEMKYAGAFLYTLQEFIGCGFFYSASMLIFQKCINTFILFCGWIFKALMVALLIKGYISRNLSETMYDKFMRDVEDYCRKYKLSDNLTANIYMYIEHKFQNNFFDENRIQQTLSGRLKADITIDHCKKLLKQVEIFKNLPHSILIQIMRHLTREIFLPGQIIMQLNTVGDKMFFLESGSAKIISELGENVGIFEDGSYFGEISLLFENTKRTSSVIAVELCEIYILSKKAFRMSVDPNSNLFKQMKAIAFERIRDYH